MSWKTDFDNEINNVEDPNPWLALHMDQSIPMYSKTKQMLLSGLNTPSRRLLLPLIRPLARLSIIMVQLLRMVLPEKLNSTRLLHKSIYWGLKTFVRKEANTLIIRHFNIGTQILRFIADNVEGAEIKSTKPLEPKNLEDLIDNTFLIHDLNIFNFIFELGEHLKNNDTDIQVRETLDFSSITGNEIEIDQLPDNWHNLIDLQTAIEIYTPMYALLLSDHDFWRASNSLQLDETIAIYISKLIGDYAPLAMVSNRHPVVPISTLESGFRLMLHGVDAEILHGFLCDLKKQQEEKGPKKKPNKKNMGAKLSKKENKKTTKKKAKKKIKKKE
jgi:hypothetical protein